MALFDSAQEKERRRKLKEAEDKRVRFAEALEKQGFAPARMVMVSTEKGALIGMSREGGKLCLVLGPEFGSEAEFVLERCDPFEYRIEEHYVPGEGMGGIFGFGKKAEGGFVVHIVRGGEEIEIPFIVNRNSGTVCGRKNPLLSTKRRRGDANIVWDIPPFDRASVLKVRAAVEEILG